MTDRVDDVSQWHFENLGALGRDHLASRSDNSSSPKLSRSFFSEMLIIG
jgi:hypothetical protein